MKLSDFYCLTIQQIAGDHTQYNKPGEVSDMNWTWRADRTMEQFLDMPVTDHFPKFDQDGVVTASNIDRIRERAKKENRKDDASDEIIDKRFNEYNEKTKPLLDLYTKSRKLIKIDGGKGREGVLKDVVNKLGLKKPLKSKK